jgi:hypothetical protein
LVYAFGSHIIIPRFERPETKADRLITVKNE